MKLGSMLGLSSNQFKAGEKDRADGEIGWQSGVFLYKR